MQNQSRHTTKYYALRHAAKNIRRLFGSKTPVYAIIRREMRKVYCEYYHCGYAEFGLSLDKFKY